MTVQEIYENMLTLALELPEDDTEYEDFVVPQFNILLQELFAHNNIARQRNKKEVLNQPPKIADRKEENPYEWQLTNALIYGLAAKLFTAGEQGLEATYLQMYYAAVNGALPAQFEDVEDYYAASGNY